MNILTFDIEEWYLEKVYHGGRAEKYAEFDRFLNIILDLLDEVNTNATFFCVGKMALDFPEIVRKIFERGHEVGCHSDKHMWLNKLSREETFEDTRTAVDALEQCTGEKILSYRAPAFSIGKNNSWAFEVLCQCGITRDASIFPAARDFGGFESFKYKEPTYISYNNHTLKEFPVSTVTLLGSKLVYSGGGYFRFFPLSFIRNQMRSNSYSMTYFHIGDLIPEINKLMSRSEYEEYFMENGNLFNRYIRYLKSNFGTKGACEKLVQLVKGVNFVSVEQADLDIEWSLAPVMDLTDLK
ncbi:DUF3473 domain-containing protein [Marnyiella aurantia]|uniref:DUF3473 domain-containing protein n=1 Tax=Marnyiella aurantia TaxID=2758037 RepID=A0A7D7QZW0_9FLAO|nr:polysaccharide deacetylase family protein [Marnyiella aurantia]MBA5247434.1 DUF3473 domain-containing protein [Marnyiella aurantia]QMS99191.1 DUF3473 domain-containing protein [Marnyiella aurantia]